PSNLAGDRKRRAAKSLRAQRWSTAATTTTSRCALYPTTSRGMQIALGPVETSGRPRKVALRGGPHVRVPNADARQDHWAVVERHELLRQLHHPGRSARAQRCRRSALSAWVDTRDDR